MYMNSMKVRNVRFSDRDWLRLRMVSVLSKMKMSDIVRRGALAFADSVTKRLNSEKDAKREAVIEVVAPVPQVQPSEQSEVI